MSLKKPIHDLDHAVRRLGSPDDPGAPFTDAFSVRHALGNLHYDARSGWREQKGEKDQSVFIKRFLGVWYKLIVGHSMFSRHVYLYPTTMPKNIPVDPGEWETLRARITCILPTEGLTLAAIERKATELARVWKEARGPRTRTDASRFEYREYRGAEALVRWKKDVEEVLQDIIDMSGKGGYDWTTELLVENVLDNYSRKIYGATRPFMSRNIAAILESMAKRKKIEKDTNERRKPKWLSLNFVPKARPGW